MNDLTERQRQVLEFIQSVHQESGMGPSLREIARHFGFQSPKAAADHVKALRRKGALTHQPGRGRSWRALSPLQAMRQLVVDLPIYGTIPAGFADSRRQEARGCVSIDVATLGFKPTPRTFVLEVRGDSMVGRHIIDGDLVVLEHGLTPKHGDVVAALIDNENTLKTFVQERGQTPCLKAENPKYPKLIPATELVIQGVMVSLIRKMKTAR